MGPGLQIINNEFGGGSIYHCSEAAYAAGNCAGTAPDTMVGEKKKAWKAAHAADVNCTGLLNVSVASRDCQGLTQASGTSISSCAQSCCENSGCTVYQWCPPGKQCDGVTGNNTAGECWIGGYSGCGDDSRDGWEGFGHSNGPMPAGPTTVTGVRIAHNSFGGNAKTTQATKSLTQTNAVVWKFDFCDVLVFPTIAFAKVHVSAATGFPVGIARPSQNCTLVVETQVAVTGTVTVEVDSSEPSTAFL